MSKYISSGSVVAALEILKDLDLHRTVRAALPGFLLLKAKQTDPDEALLIKSTGPQSVEAEIIEFLRIAPSTPFPDVIPFGTQEDHLVFVKKEYERRGTYTHLDPRRTLERILDVEEADDGRLVRIPPEAAGAIAEKLKDKIPLEPTAAFLMRHKEFDDDADSDEVVAAFQSRFHLRQSELDAIFVKSDFAIEFSTDPFVDRLSSLPPSLHPKTEGSGHETVSRAAREIIPLAQNTEFDLILDDTLERRIQRTIANSKAVALVGPPGTAKTSILIDLLEQASADPELFSFKRSPRYSMVTAEVDWTARTIIGGYYPREDGLLVFREGCLLRALMDDQILLIDEMNRADLDRVLGPVLTFLTGQAVDLGLTHLGSETSGDKPKRMVLAWSKTAESGMQEDDEQRVYFAGTDWRLLGTYNNVDRGRVFPMGSALQRRWALVPVAPISPSLAYDLLEGAGTREAVTKLLAEAYAVHLRYLSIGIAPFLEMARYVGDDGSRAGADAVTPHELELLQDAYVIFMGQQLSRLDPEAAQEFFDELAGILGQNLASEASRL